MTATRFDAIDSGLTAAQHAAVHDDAAALCIVAGAGSGKTRVLTRRVARRLLDGSADPAGTVVVTFTRKAAGELYRRLDALAADPYGADGPAVGTFHALAYGQLRTYWELRGLPACSVTPSRHRIVADVLADMHVRADPATVRTVVGEIDWAKARLCTPDRYADVAADRRVRLGATRTAEVYARYEEYKLRRRVIDFDDMLTLLADALRRDEAFARVIRRRTRHVFVDEFQDVSAAQHALLREWSPIKGAAEDADVCVVGDDDQAIFGFAGARASYLTDFASHWPDARVIVLSDNFRCPPAVLDVAAAVLPSTDDDPGAAAGGRERGAVRAHVAHETVPTLTAHADGDAEMRHLAVHVRTHRRTTGVGGDRWQGIAVLVRTNAQAATVQEALARHAVPCVVRTVASFTTRDGARPVLDILTRDRRPPGLPFVDWVADACDTVAAERSARTPAAVGTSGAARSDDTGDGDSDSDVLAQLVDLATDYAESVPRPDAAGFVQFVRASMAGDAVGAAEDAVTVMTMHRAKGLEFDTVYVPMLEEGFVPLHGASSDPAALAEERRLLYVTMTRARRELHLSWAGARRSRDGRLHDRRRSRFLDPVDDVLARFTAATAPAVDPLAHVASARAAIREQREPSGTSTSPHAGHLDDTRHWARRDALAAWRAEVAQRRRVPAESVLTSPLLERIAVAGPTDWAALAAVPGVDHVLLRRDGRAILDRVATTDARETRHGP